MSKRATRLKRLKGGIETRRASLQGAIDEAKAAERPAPFYERLRESFNDAGGAILAAGESTPEEETLTRNQAAVNLEQGGTQ